MTQNVVRPQSTPRSAAALLTSGSLLAVGTGAGAFAAALLATPAGASAFTVTTLASAGAGSLRQAIINANTSPGADTIDFAPGVTGEIWLTSNLPTISEGVTITGPGATALAINGVSLYHAFDIDTQGTGAVTISGLTVTHSAWLGALSGDSQGGAVRVIDTSITLDAVVIRDSSSASITYDAFGGGIFVSNGLGLGDVTISNSVIAGNGALSSSQRAAAGGGGAWIEADNITIEGTEISENTSKYAGGAYVTAWQNLTIDDSLIANNLSHDYIGGLAAGGHAVVVTDSVVSGNVSENSVGGIYIGTDLYFGSLGSPALTMTNTRISDNSATEIGGGLVFSLETPALLDQVTVTGNVGGDIGGLDVLGNMTMSSSTIAGNIGAGINVGYWLVPTSVSACSLSTPSSGFAPRARLVQPATPGPREPDTVTLANSTVTNNSREGISLNNRGLSVESNSVSPARCGSVGSEVNLGLVHVLAADNGLEDVAAKATSLFSLIETPNAGVIAGFGTITGVDPGLLPLQDVSDTVSVVPIAMGSAAWNAGNPNFTPPPATDQRGLPRVVDVIDIGAYEVQEQLLLPKFTG